MRLNKLYFILLLILLYIINAQSNVCESPEKTILPSWYCSQVNTIVTNTWLTWYPIVIIAVFASFSIGTILFMLSFILNNSKLRDFAIAEFYEAGATALIVISFLFIMALIFGGFPGLLIGNIDPYNTSLYYINSTINQTETLINSLYKVYVVAAPITTLTLSVYVSAFKVPNSIFPILFSLINIFVLLPIETITPFLADGLLLLNIEFYIILFAMYFSIPLFIIPGVVFRSILPTRHIGGLMIGIGIGLYGVMPVLFALSYGITTNGLASTFSSISSRLNTLTNEGVLNTGINPPGNPNSIATQLNAISSSIGSYFLSVLFFPMLIYSITYATIITISDFLGGLYYKPRGLLSMGII